MRSVRLCPAMAAEQPAFPQEKIDSARAGITQMPSMSPKKCLPANARLANFRWHSEVVHLVARRRVPDRTIRRQRSEIPFPTRLSCLAAYPFTTAPGGAKECERVSSSARPTLHCGTGTGVDVDFILLQVVQTSSIRPRASHQSICGTNYPLFQKHLPREPAWLGHDDVVQLQWANLWRKELMEGAQFIHYIAHHQVNSFPFCNLKKFVVILARGA